MAALILISFWLDGSLTPAWQADDDGGISTAYNFPDDLDLREVWREPSDDAPDDVGKQREVVEAGPRSFHARTDREIPVRYDAGIGY